MSGFQLHPKAYTDIEDLWEFIAEDSWNAADRARDKIYDAIQGLVSFPTTDISVAISPRVLCASGEFTIT